MCHQRDWSDLPIELINLVSKKLLKLSDYVKFRVVCKTWCSSAPLSDHPPQLPWLIEHKPGSNIVNGLHFHSPFSGETSTIFRKEFDHGTHCMRLGPSNGSLLLYDRSINTHSYVLFNPLTNEKTCLPPLHFSRPCLVWTGTNPTHSQDVIVIEQQYFPTKNHDSLAFYDRDNNDWIILSKSTLVYSSCYFKGMLFLSNMYCFTFVFDISTKKKLHKIPPPDDVFAESPMHLVESAGEILFVSKDLGRWIDFEKKTTFRIYKLAFDGKNSHVCWVKISNIGDQMLFLDRIDGFSINSRSFPGQRGNCIYFLYANRMPCRYNIEDGKTEKLWSPFVLRSLWFVPDLR